MDGALKAGYSKSELVDYLAGTPAKITAENAPPVPRPQVDMEEEDLSGKPINPRAGAVGVPGGSANPQPASNKYAAAVGLPVAGAAAVLSGAAAGPALLGTAKAIGNWAEANPVKALALYEVLKDLIPGLKTAKKVVGAAQ